MISTPLTAVTNDSWVNTPYEVAHVSFWMPLPHNWANLGRKRRLKYIRFMRKKGKTIENRFSRARVPRLTDGEIHDLFFRKGDYMGELAQVNFPN